MKIDISKVTNPKAKDFLITFFTNREINRQFYQRVPEGKFNFRMVNTSQRKSDSPRESLTHQIKVQKTYLKAIQTGELIFKGYDQLKLKAKTKKALLTELKKIDQELINLLANNKNLKKEIKVPWSKKPVGAVDMVWALDSHETLHTGWNLAIMDHLNIKRFPALKKIWG